MSTENAGPLADLTAAGVSLWLDDLSRDRITTGNLAELIPTKHISASPQPDDLRRRAGQGRGVRRAGRASWPARAPRGRHRPHADHRRRA